MKKALLFAALILISGLSEASSVQTSDDLDQIFEKETSQSAAPIYNNANEETELRHLEAQLEPAPLATETAPANVMHSKTSALGKKFPETKSIQQ